MRKGDIVYPRTKAGLELSTSPVDGTWRQSREVACVLKGRGQVLKTKQVTIDYDDWDIKENRPPAHLGQIRYTNCFVKCKNGCGWAGADALVKKSRGR